MKHLIAFVWLPLLLMGMVTPAFGQLLELGDTVIANYGISGRVSDEQDRPVPGASIVVFTPDSVVGHAMCDSLGVYTLPSLRSGAYDIVIETPSGRNFAMYGVWFSSDIEDSRANFQVFMNVTEGHARMRERKKHDGLMQDGE